MKRYTTLLTLLFLIILSSCTGGEEMDDPILVSGFVEGKEIEIASEVGGLVAEVLVNEGDEVEVGQVLLRLDDTLLQSQRGEALAAVAAAEANLARVQAGARPAERAAARAVLQQAIARRDGAAQALEDARQALENPQELDAQIAQARTQVALAEQAVEMARAELNEFEVKYNVYASQGGDTERSWALQVEAARAAVESAQAQLSGAQRYLSALYTIRENPLTLEAQVHLAEAEYAAAKAEVDAAAAAVSEVEAGPTPEEVKLAQAQYRQAQAGLALLDAQISQLTITSPIDGIVATRSIHSGETATPGSTLLTLTNLDQVTLVLYIPENRIGQVYIGQPVEVTVDSFPGQVFEGRVMTIAGEAEFTPRSVQTQEERVNLVFAIRVSIPNPDHALKPGMPADAVLAPRSP